MTCTPKKRKRRKARRREKKKKQKGKEKKEMKQKWTKKKKRSWRRSSLEGTSHAAPRDSAVHRGARDTSGGNPGKKKTRLRA